MYPRSLMFLWKQIAANANVKKKHTNPCKAIHPFWNSISCQPITDILAEMVAVLCDQMIGISIVVYRLKLHELSNLHWV